LFFERESSPHEEPPSIAALAGGFGSVWRLLPAGRAPESEAGDPGASGRAESRSGFSLPYRLARTLERGLHRAVRSTLQQRLGAGRSRMPTAANSSSTRSWGSTATTRAGCHLADEWPGDTQSIAIGIQNNNLVGLGRTGRRNQRRTPI
jgi:hypothetical protein